MTKELEQRRGRVEETRSRDNRQLDHNRILKNILGTPATQLDIDKDIIPEGKQYMWGRDSLLGQPDMNRLSELRGKGFTAVPSAHHPEMFAEEIPWRKNRMDEYIYRGGLVLLERDKVYEEIEQKKILENNIRSITSNAASQDHMNDPYFPMRSYINETGVNTIATRESFQD